MKATLNIDFDGTDTTVTMRGRFFFTLSNVIVGLQCGQRSNVTFDGLLARSIPYSNSIKPMSLSRLEDYMYSFLHSQRMMYKKAQWSLVAVLSSVNWSMHSEKHWPWRLYFSLQVYWSNKVTMLWLPISEKHFGEWFSANGNQRTTLPRRSRIAKSNSAKGKIGERVNERKWLSPKFFSAKSFQ